MDQPQTVTGVKLSLKEMITPVSCAGNEVESFKLTTSSRSSDFPVSVIFSRMDARFVSHAIEKQKPMDGLLTGINAKRLEQEVFDFT